MLIDLFAFSISKITFIREPSLVDNLETIVVGLIDLDVHVSDKLFLKVKRKFKMMFKTCVDF